ncbi:MAG: GAF domain-containing protein [Holophagaceae bacterium]
MDTRPSRQPATPPMEPRGGRALHALAGLLRREDLDPFALFDAALELLVRHFQVDHALITRLQEGQLDTFWWAHAGTGAKPPMELHQGLNLCARVLQEPDGRLALGDVFRSEGGPWLRAFAGVALREGTRPVGTLALLHSRPFVFTAEDLDFLRSVAGVVGRAMEVENLKYELQVARDALALSSAVVEDSALESQATGLPNRRYLEVWMKGHLHHARRNKGMLAVATWAPPSQGPRRGAVLRAAAAFAQSLRGEDLVVELAPDRLLLLLPQTAQEGAEHVLQRAWKALGRPAVGATLWLADRDDLMMQAALRRAEQARAEAARQYPAGGIVWRLPTLVALDAPP